MDFQNKFETELVFKVELKDKEEKQTSKQKKVTKMASINLKKMVIDKLNGRTGDC